MIDLMLVVPHPDDEVFGLGGALIRTAAEGRHSAVMTLTRGRGGRSLGLCTPARLGELREAELRAAAKDLGVHELIIEDHHDFVPDDERGIPHDPGLQALAPERLAREIAAEIDRLRPRVLVTFGPTGSNGHPDHVTTCLRTHEALARCAHRPESIYHYASPEPYPGPDRPGFLGFEEIRAGYTPPSHRIVLTKEELAGKLRAMGRHKSQALSVLGFMEQLTGRLFMETFAEVDLGGRPLHPGEPVRTVDLL